MSHVPQRKEKDCLNCGTIVQGRYCQVCGQENVVPKETFWHMVTHFFYDITHFDSNFFKTVKDLLFKPGFLSKEYMKGRRASYLHPIKMYVFTSAIFFLLFFSFFKPAPSLTDVDKPLNAGERAEYISIVEQALKKDSTNSSWKEKLLWGKDTSHRLKTSDLMKLRNKSGFSISFSDKEYNSFKEYDSVQKSLTPSKRDGWIGRRLTRMDINIREKVREDPNAAAKKFMDSLLHRMPYMLLISLPFFALLLKLVYIRRKQFYYADHGVFTIHLYVFTFLHLLAVLSVQKLGDALHWGFNWLVFLLFFLLFFYLYKAMRNFYGQRRAKTFIKFLMVAISSLLMMVILFLLFMFFSAATL